MTKPIPEEPAFIRNITSFQKVLASIAVTMMITAWVTGFNFISDFFKPDFVEALRYLRVGMALMAITLTSVVGYQQLKSMLNWLADSWEVYKNLMELKRNKDKKE